MNVKWYTSDTPEKKVYSNKEIEKYFEDIGIFVSYHEEDIGGGKKKGVLTPIKKNMEILNDFEKTLDNGQSVNFQIENPDGELKKVSKEEFAKWMEKEKEAETPPKESLVYGASGDVDGITVFTERKGKDGFIRESYYQPRDEEKKKQIVERNKKRRELEKSQKEDNKENTQVETSPNSNDENNQNLEKSSQSSFSQNKDNNSNKAIYWGIGIFSFLVLVGLTIFKKVKKINK